MSSHCVVVWEYQSEGQWLPHTPGVTRTLERAHAKKLTRVVLADADPALKGHYVNLRTLTQCQDTPDGGTVEAPVRRACYGAGGAGGRGARWEWARLVSPPAPADLDYQSMPMELQCVLEGAWCAGAEGGLVSWRGWALCVSRGTARRGAALRLLRRVTQPPYPRDPPPQPPHPPDRPNRTVAVRRARIPQQHTGSSVHSVQSTVSNISNHSNLSNHSNHSAHSGQSSHSAPGACRGGARSASPKDRKPGLARQILHNLNIFSNHKGTAPGPAGAPSPSERESEAEEQRGTDTECGSTRSGRRHSVDTVSTYLSHESKDSLQDDECSALEGIREFVNILNSNGFSWRGSVGELLNCSGGSDDVFDPPPARRDPPPADNTVLGVSGLPAALCAHVVAVPCPQWGALCPVCLQPLGGGGAALALRGCQHMLHLHCLVQNQQEPLCIECLVCGRVYGSGGEGAPPAPPPAPAGAQPPGSMAWRLQHAPLPHQGTHTSILVTYNFQSGRQGPEQPAPGAPYYAVGFPRHSLLPDTPLGRQVLSALRVAWERRVLFTVCASQTTGREHVVAWRVQPPPAERAHYAPPANPARLLLSALSRLHALIHPADH